MYCLSLGKEKAISLIVIFSSKQDAYTNISCFTLPQVLVLQAKSEQSKRENYHMSILGLSKA
jgi:hypothetical protein